MSDPDRLGTNRLRADPDHLAALVDGGAIETQTLVLRTDAGRVRVTASGDGGVRVESVE